jgi:hypothetical protein
VLRSALGDDAVVLGAVALAQEHVGRNPFKKGTVVKPKYREIVGTSFGEVIIGRKTYSRDVCIRVDGKVRKRNKALAKEVYGTSHKIGPKELVKVCRGGPEVLFVGTGHSGQIEVTEEAKQYLSQRAIELRAVPTPEVAEAYNKSDQRKAAVIHVTC